MAAGAKLAGIQEHDAQPNIWELVRKLVIAENRLLRNDVLQQRPQSRNVPLAVPKLINKMVLSFFQGNMKSLIKRPVRGAHPQAGVQHQKRLAHSVYDILRVSFHFRQQPRRPPLLSDIFHGKNKHFRVVAGTKLTGV